MIGKVEIYGKGSEVEKVYAAYAMLMDSPVHVAAQAAEALAPVVNTYLEREPNHPDYANLGARVVNPQAELIFEINLQK